MMIDLVEAERIIRRHQKKPPIQVGAIAKDMGINVIKDKSLPSMMYGMLKKENNQFVIYVNSNHLRRKQNEIIAHEIGHYLLGFDRMNPCITDRIVCYRKEGLRLGKMDRMLETAATRIALDIQIPRDLLSQYIDKGIIHADELADIFNVTRSTMLLRLSETPCGDNVFSPSIHQILTR